MEESKGKDLAEDPIQRYERLLTRIAPVSRELEPAALQPIIQEAAGQSDKEVSTLSEHVAEHSTLTVAEARPVVTHALEGQANPAAKAAAVSKAVTSAAGASANIELSDPVMLNPTARAVFASLLFLALLVCIGCIVALGESSGAPGSGLVGLAIVGILSLVGILVLVMGYKNVTIKGGPPTS
jgi:hypothetical protein